MLATYVHFEKAGNDWRVEVRFSDGRIGVGFASILTDAVRHAINDALQKPE